MSKDLENPSWWRENAGVRIPDKNDPPVPDPDGVVSVDDKEEADRKHLRGFTVDELVEQGALARGREDNVKPNNLQGPIHPAFDLPNWEEEPFDHFWQDELYPLGNDPNGKHREGFWSAHNPVVWQALEPCLRLASKFVEHAQMFSWYDALIYGPRNDISATASKHKVQSISYHVRPEFPIPKTHADMKSHMEMISGVLRLGICKGDEDPRNGELHSSGMTYSGISYPPVRGKYDTSSIYLDYNTLEPLLMAGLRPSTRLALQFNVALTLLHEFAHVLSFQYAGDPPLETKLYFDKEDLPEVGFSFETNTFGAHPVLLLRTDKDPHYSGELQAGFLLEDWLGKNRIIDVPSKSPKYSAFRQVEYRSLPLSFVEELGQEEFWKCFFKRWGADTLKVYPLDEGRLVTLNGDAYEASTRLDPPDEEPAWSMYARNPPPNQSQEPNEAQVLKFARERIARATNIAQKAKSRKTADLAAIKAYEVWSSGELERNRPWNIRIQHIMKQAELFAANSERCHAHVIEANKLLSRKDEGSTDYLQTKERLDRENERDLGIARAWRDVALDKETSNGYSRIETLYVKQRVELKLNPREPSVDIVEDARLQDAKKEANRLIDRAQELYRDKNYQECAKMCYDIQGMKYISNEGMGASNLLLAITADRDLRIWHAVEAVRLFNLVVEANRGTTKGSSAERLAGYASATLRIAFSDAKNVVPPALLDQRPAGSSGGVGSSGGAVSSGGAASSGGVGQVHTSPGTSIPGQGQGGGGQAEGTPPDVTSGTGTQQNPPSAAGPIGSGEPSQGISGSSGSGSGKSSPGKASSGKPGSDKPGSDKPGSDKPGSDKPGSDKPGLDKAGPDNPIIISDTSSSDTSSSDTSGSDKAGSDKAGSVKAGSDKAGSVKAGSDKAGSVKASSDKAGSVKASSEKASPDNPITISDTSSSDTSSSGKDSPDKSGPALPLSNTFQAFQEQANIFNQARNSFHNGNPSNAETILLKLVGMPNLATTLKAQCRMYLARITWRTDRLEQARRGLMHYREMEAGATSENLDAAKAFRVQAETFVADLQKTLSSAPPPAVGTGSGSNTETGPQPEKSIFSFWKLFSTPKHGVDSEEEEEEDDDDYAGGNKKQKLV